MKHTPLSIAGFALSLGLVTLSADSRNLRLEDYMDLGALEASDVARAITGSPTVNAMG